jgi:hypothetical protein
MKGDRLGWEDFLCQALGPVYFFCLYWKGAAFGPFFVI